MYIEAADRLSEVPHHSGARVPSQKSTYHGTNAQSSQIETQDATALAGNYNDIVSTCTNPFM
jgi:hypothetical protein